MRLTVVITILFFSLNGLIAQVGIKLGVHSFDLSSPKDIILPNEDVISFSDSKLGFQAGVYGRLDLSAIFIEPRIMLHSTKVEYSFNSSNGSLTNALRSESFTNLDIPIMVGTEILFFDVYLGPVAHFNLGSTSDLFDIAGYKTNFDTADFGWRGGLHFGLGQVGLDLEYEGNLFEFGKHINVDNESYTFENNPSRLILNLQIQLF